MRERVQGLLSAGPPVARQHFAWLPRLSNDSVRLFERSLAAAFPAGPPVYVCSSLKEEFGIAVLEAMDAGLLAIAPRSGGASWYIKPGMTGFLADTSSAWSLATDLSAILGQHQSQRALAAIARQGQKTVQAEYGIESSARKFAAYYRRLLSPSPSHSAAEADAALLK